MPVRNEADFIARSLRSVLQQDYSVKHMEIFVVDGMSTDATRDIVMSIAKDVEHEISLVENRDLIVPAGLNRAIELSKGDIIIRVDGHCEIALDYVSQCVRLLQSTEFAGVGGPIETVSESPIGIAIAAAMSSKFGVGNSAFRTEKIQVTDVDTIAFPAYWRNTVEHVGRFDETLVRNQDDEYNYRLRGMGYRLLLDPAIRSRYYSRVTITRLIQQYYQYGLYKVRVLQKHPRQIKPRQLVPAIFVTVVIVGALLSPFNNVTRITLLLVIGAYIAANAIASLITVTEIGWRHLPLLPIVFAALHFSYGFGFLCGLWAFRNRWKTE